MIYIVRATGQSNRPPEYHGSSRTWDARCKLIDELKAAMAKAGDDVIASSAWSRDDLKLSIADYLEDAIDAFIHDECPIDDE